MSSKPVVIDPVKLISQIHGESIKMPGFMADNATASWKQADLTFTSVWDRKDVVIRYKNRANQRVKVLRKVTAVALFAGGLAAGWFASEQFSTPAVPSIESLLKP